MPVMDVYRMILNFHGSYNLGSELAQKMMTERLEVNLVTAGCWVSDVLPVEFAGFVRYGYD